MTDKRNTDEVLDKVLFLEWLDISREVVTWAYPNETHEDTALKWIAHREGK